MNTTDFLFFMIGNIIREIGSIIADLFRKEEAWLIVIVLLGAGIFTAFALPSIDIEKIFFYIWLFFKGTWWLWLFIVLFPIAKSIFLHWRQEDFKSKIKFILLELNIPREIKRSPRAMEQVLAALHTLRNSPGDIGEKYADGEVTAWFTFEMASFGGEIHFYVRGQRKQRNLIEAAIFSYYPDIEIEEVDDYLVDFPDSLKQVYDEKKDFWSTEMLLAREEAYPIKTYKDFENDVEEKDFDPISIFMEILGKVKEGEFVGIQINAAPAGHEWKDRWEPLVEDLRKKVSYFGGSDKDLPEGEKMMQMGRSPGQYDVLRAVESALAKPAFDTLIRFIYLAPQETYYDSFARRGLVGSFNQYAALDMNSFIQNYAVSTRSLFWYWPHIFPKVRNEYKKQRAIPSYKNRAVPPETWIGRLITSSLFSWNFKSKMIKMNTECIATLFHPPTAVVLTAPHVKRVESRKGGAPAGLPIYGKDDEEIRKLFS